MLYSMSEKPTQPKKRGPKPKFGETMKRMTISVDPMTRRKLAVVAKGNVSDWVRRMADAEYERYQKD